MRIAIPMLVLLLALPACDHFESTPIVDECGGACGEGTECRAFFNGSYTTRYRCVEAACEDGIDNDRNGAVDCDDLWATCGCYRPPDSCGGCMPGSVCEWVPVHERFDGRSSVCRETACFDGIDNDGDGNGDCAATRSVDTDCRSECGFEDGGVADGGSLRRGTRGD